MRGFFILIQESEVRIGKVFNALNDFEGKVFNALNDFEGKVFNALNDFEGVRGPASERLNS